MGHLTQLLAIAILGAGLALTAAAPAGARLDAPAAPIVCPSGEITILRGRGPQHTALLVFFNHRPVGGGLTDAAGRWEIPLLVTEAPGVYPVEVRTRLGDGLLQRLDCFVDQPIETPAPGEGAPQPATRTPMPTRTPAATSAASPAPARTPPPGDASPTATAPLSPTATGEASPTPSATATTPAAASTATSTATRTITPTRTPSATPSPSPTEQTAANPQLKLVELGAADPGYPIDLGYLVIENNSDGRVSLDGWTVGSLTAGRPRYTFPQVTLRSNAELTLEVRVGPDDLAGLWLYWNRTAAAWESGETVVLYTPAGVEHARAVVP